MPKHTALYESHQQLTAHLVDFAGWDLPLHYGSQIIEHQQVREDAGMFDVSHMGIIDIQGLDAQLFLSYLLANNINKLKQPGQALYSCLLNESAGIIDDLIVYFLAPNVFRLVVNASRTAVDLAWIKQQAAKFSVEVRHRSDLGILAVQGPNSREKVGLAFPQYQKNIQALKPFQFFLVDEEKRLAEEVKSGSNLLIGRTGYTGEDGLEIILPAETLKFYWDAFLAVNISPVGLGARDTLRLEAGLNLYGHDMDETVTPFEANLTWTVAMEPASRDFIGRRALDSQQSQGVDKKLVGIILLEKGVLRQGQKLLQDNKLVGLVTSGSFSPTLKKSIALARIHSNIQGDCYVEIRDRILPVQIVQPPFVRKRHAKNT
jgi:aminomethyltransferase